MVLFLSFFIFQCLVKTSAEVFEKNRKALEELISSETFKDNSSKLHFWQSDQRWFKESTNVRKWVARGRGSKMCKSIAPGQGFRKWLQMFSPSVVVHLFGRSKFFAAYSFHFACVIRTLQKMITNVYSVSCFTPVWSK